MLSALRRSIPRLIQATRTLTPAAPTARTLATSGAAPSSVFELREYNVTPSMFGQFLALTNSHIHLRTKYSKLVGYASSSSARDSLAALVLRETEDVRVGSLGWLMSRWFGRCGAFVCVLGGQLLDGRDR